MHNWSCPCVGTRSRRVCEWACRWIEWVPLSTIADRVVAGGLTGRDLPSSRQRRSAVLGGKIWPMELPRKGIVLDLRVAEGPLRVASARSKIALPMRCLACCAILVRFSPGAYNYPDAALMSIPMWCPSPKPLVGRRRRPSRSSSWAWRRRMVSTSSYVEANSRKSST
jgi:hypothetical protein